MTAVRASATPTTPATGHHPSTRRRLAGWARHPAALAAGGFLAVRAIGLLAVLSSPTRAGRPMVEVLSVWDGGWYVRIAENGYADHLDLSAPLIDQSTGSLAFFPLYPMLIRAVAALTGLDPRWAGVAISLTAGAVAAAGIAVLAANWAGGRVGVLAGLLWSAAPMGVVTAIGYSEALFTALTVWAFVAARRHCWLLAGLLGASAGLTRPAGIAVGIALAAFAAWTWWQRLTSAGTSEPSAATTYGSSDVTRGFAPLAAGALALIATPAFWLWVGGRAGRWDGWFAVQAEFWGSRIDGGVSLLTLARDVVLGRAVPGTELVGLVAVVAAIGSVALLGLAIRGRVWWPLLVYGAISLGMVLGTAGYFSSKLRFLVPVFVLALPLAHWLAGRSRPTVVIVLSAAVIASTSIGTYMLLSWPYAI